MKITFILKNLDLSGGVKAVFEFSNELKRSGHVVKIAVPFLPIGLGPKGYDLKAWKNRILRAIKNLTHGIRPDWFDVEAEVIVVPYLSDKYIPDADVIIATWWETAYFVHRCSLKKGRKYYLAQHFETWGGPIEDVKESYRLGLNIIANSTWLVNMIEHKAGISAGKLILHSPDREHFYPEDNKVRDNNLIRILMPYRTNKWKGVEDGIKAFKKAKETCSGIKLVMFGTAKGCGDIPAGTEFHKRPTNDELRHLYNTCDIFLFPSWYEGFGMPPMEAMACKCAVVTTDVGAVSDYAVAGNTAMVSPARDTELLAENLRKLINDRNLRNHIANAGFEYIRGFTWKRAAKELEDYLREK